jgi:HK97 gp10 family phage protein
MSVLTTYYPNPALIALMEASELVAAGVEAKAELLADAARANAPEDTGALIASIGVKRARGVNYEVAATVPYAAYVEFGTEDTPRFRFMGRAIDEVF